MLWSQLTEKQRRSIERRILHHTKRFETHDCVIWTGTVIGKNYGQLSVGFEGKIYVHKYILCKELGRDLLETYKALHTCDNIHGPCINKTHLYEGTSKQNTHDMWNRGRAVVPDNTGELHGMAVLTETKVLQIDRMISQRIPYKDIALQFQVSLSTISDIKYRRSWKHVLGVA